MWEKNGIELSDQLLDQPILVGLFYRQNNCQGFQVNDQIIYEGKLIRLTLEFSGAAYNLWPQGSYIFKKSKKRSATQKFYTQPNFASISNYRKTVSNISNSGNVIHMSHS